MVKTTELVRCDGCGQLFPKETLRKCKSCGSVLCPSCRKHHTCNGVGSSPSPYTMVNQNPENQHPPAAAASDPNNPWSKYRYSDSGLWIFPPASLYLKSQQGNQAKTAATSTAYPYRTKNTAKAKTSFDVGPKNFAEIFEISDTAALLDTDITLEHETSLYLLQDDAVILTLEPGAHASTQIVETKVRNHEFDPDMYTEVCLTRSIPIKIPYNISISQKSANPSIISRVKGIAAISIANPIVVKREYLFNHSSVLIDVIQTKTVEAIQETIDKIAMEFTMERLNSEGLNIPALSQELTQKYSVTLKKDIDAWAEVRGLKVAVSNIEIELTPEALVSITAKKTADSNQKTDDDVLTTDESTLLEKSDQRTSTKGEV